MPPFRQFPGRLFAEKQFVLAGYPTPPAPVPKSIARLVLRFDNPARQNFRPKYRISQYARFRRRQYLGAARI